MGNGESSYRRFLDGEDEGLTLIIKEYKDGLILYLNRYVNNLYVAEELMQETFFKIAVKKPKFKERSSFKTWLYTIGRHLAVDYLRHRAKTAAHPVDSMADNRQDEINLEKLYIQSERKNAIHKALAGLKPEYQQVLWLVFFEDFSNEEAARVMDKSKRQIENLVFRAKRALKSTLVKEGFEYEEL